MAAHNTIGSEGEKLAAEWLEQHGYSIIHRNWRYSYYEIDIIARKGKRIHFIEVKARSAQRCGYPEDSVGRKKFRRLQRAADEFLYLNPGHRWIQFDILSIVIGKNGEVDYFLIEDIG